MRVLVTATTFPRYKQDTEPAFVFNLSREMAKRGFETVVLVPHHHKAKHFEIIDDLKVYRFPYFYPAKLQKLCYDGGIIPNIKKSLLAKIQVPFLLLAEFFYVRKLIKKERVDFIHAHWVIPQGLIASIIKKLYRVPYIATAHAGDIFPLKSGFLRFFGKMALGNADFCTVNSSYTKKSVLGVSRIKNIEIIPMGVNLSDFNKNKKNRILRRKYNVKGPFLLSVGRLAEKKGIEYLIQAMQPVLKEYPNAKLTIVGDGPERENLENLANNLNLKENVIFVGRVSKKGLPEYYATADIFIGPSIVTKSGDTEGLGVVFLEAIASGTAVIGSNVGGIPDIIKDRYTGLLVEQKNPKQLAEKITFLLKNPRIRKRLIKNAQKHINKNYSWKTVAAKFEKIYKKIPYSVKK